jgi:ABC-type spermidine/putrescine transport system permease subunit II
VKPEINAICSIMIAVVATGIVAASLLTKFHDVGRDSVGAVAVK